jgi:hypothetical protein
VTWAQVLAGKQIFYSAGGDHEHQLLVTADDFALLASGATLVKSTSYSAPGPHLHEVRIECGPLPG